MVVRDGCIRRLREGRGHPTLVKIIGSIGKCGTTTVLEQFAAELVASGVPEDDVVLIRLDEPENSGILTREDLAVLVSERLSGSEHGVLIIDGIQRIPEWDRFALSVCTKGTWDLYVCGTGGHMVASGIRSSVTVRSVEIWLPPLSFHEYYTLHGDLGTPDEVLGLYMRYGGMPVVDPSMGGRRCDIILRGLVSSIMMADIAGRQMTPNATTAMKVAYHLFSEIGSPVNMMSVSKGTGISQNTVEKYIVSLVDNGVFRYARRYDLRDGRTPKTNGRFYAEDLGQCRTVLSRDVPAQPAAENLAFMELCRRGCDVVIGNDGEEDLGLLAAGDGARTLYAVVDGDGSGMEAWAERAGNAAGGIPLAILATRRGGPASVGRAKVLNLTDWLLDDGCDPRVVDAPAEWHEL